MPSNIQRFYMLISLPLLVLMLLVLPIHPSFGADAVTRLIGYWQLTQICGGFAKAQTFKYSTFDLDSYMDPVMHENARGTCSQVNDQNALFNYRDDGRVYPVENPQTPVCVTASESSLLCQGQTLALQNGGNSTLTLVTADGAKLSFERISEKKYVDRRDLIARKIAEEMRAVQSLSGKTLVLQRIIHITESKNSKHRFIDDANDVADKSPAMDDEGNSLIMYNAKQLKFSANGTVLINNELQSRYAITMSSGEEALLSLYLTVKNGTLDETVPSDLGHVERQGSRVTFTNKFIASPPESPIGSVTYTEIYEYRLE